jgi:hypothetical protein
MNLIHKITFYLWTYSSVWDYVWFRIIFCSSKEGIYTPLLLIHKLGRSLCVEKYLPLIC